MFFYRGMKGLLKCQFSFKIQISLEIHLSKIQFLAIKSIQLFAHAMAAQLLCHVQNFEVITLSMLGWKQNKGAHSLIDISTHWGLVTPYGDTGLGQHWLR